MNPNLFITITTKTRKGRIWTENKLVITGQIANTGGLDEHEIAARLFAIEFAANGQTSLPMRMHIGENI